MGVSTPTPGSCKSVLSVIAVSRLGGVGIVTWRKKEDVKEGKDEDDQAED